MSPPETPPLDVRVSGGDGALTAQIVGELDLVTAPYLKQRLDALREEGARHLTLDLATLSFIDSSGLSALVSALKVFRAEGGDVVLRSPTRATAKVLEISGLTQVFTIEAGGDPGQEAGGSQA